MKPKSRKNKEMQQRIADCLRTGLPLAGLISTLLSATGCDRFFAPTVVGKVPSREEHVVGDIGPIGTDNGEKQAVDGENNEKPDDDAKAEKIAEDVKGEEPTEDAKPEKANTPPPPPGVPPSPKVVLPIKRTAGIPPRPKRPNVEKDTTSSKTE